MLGEVSVVRRSIGFLSGMEQLCPTYSITTYWSDVVARKPKTETSAFATILSSLLNERKLTNKQASVLAGTNPSTIQDWKSGTSPSDLVAVKRLADALGVSMAYLTTGEADKAQQPRVETVFSEGAVLFDGYAKIFIQALTERNKRGGK